MKILNIGSLNIDYVYSVDHAVRPGETISASRRQVFCGGKGLNQSIALSRAGANVYHAGKIGNDGLFLRERLAQNGVNTDYVKVEEGISTGHAIIQVDTNGQNCIVIYGGANTSITESDIDDILNNFQAGDLLLLQNEISNIGYAIEKAHEKGMKIALNPSPIGDLASSDKLKYVDWFLLNEVEGFEITGEKTGRKICIKLVERFPKCKVVLTLGEQGCIYYDGSNFYEHGIYKVKAVDTTAAGDTFTGYFLTCIMENMEVGKALALASKASSIAVSRPGASDSIPDRKEVENTNLAMVRG